MNWDLVWAVVAIAVVAQLSYAAGRWRGFGVGVVAMRQQVERMFKEEVEKMEAEEEENEREKTT